MKLLKVMEAKNYLKMMMNKINLNFTFLFKYEIILNIIILLYGLFYLFKNYFDILIIFYLK